MLETIDALADVDAAVKQWLEAANPDTLAIQQGDYPEIKDPHMMFQLIDVETDEYTCIENKRDELGQPIRCTTTQHRLIYQVDAMYCPNNIVMLTRLNSNLKAGCLKQYENLSYQLSSNINRIPFYRQNALHYKSTVSIELLFKEHECKPVNTMETFNIGACVDAPELPDITVTNP